MSLECQIIHNFGHQRENFRKLDVQMCRAENIILAFLMRRQTLRQNLFIFIKSAFNKIQT
jgi:hypothetical protein